MAKGDLCFFEKQGEKNMSAHGSLVRRLPVGADDERTGVVIEERAEAVVVRLLGLESSSGRHLC